jgi:hypothetical protein
LKLATKTLILEASARIFFSSKKYNKESSSLSNVYVVMISKECKMEENIGSTLLILFSQNLHHNDQMQKGREGGQEGGWEEARKEGRSSTRMSKEKNKTHRHDCHREPDK